ncbi:MAG: RecX family transcriptional regulator [Actinomycetota bacterium]|nr:RecX family transcriptional regulator [Actinomycetota bacterium]
MAATRRVSRRAPLPGQSAPLGEGEGVFVHEPAPAGIAADADSGADRSGGEDRRPRGTARDGALRLLTFRARSRRELRDRLLRAGFDAAEVDDALDGLEAVGLIDDRRLAEAVVEHAVTVRMAGRRSVVGALRARRIDSDVAEDVLGGADPAGDEHQRAHDLAARRAARLRGLEPEVAFRRLASFLARRGYSPGLAREAAARALAVGPDGEA